MQLLNFDISDAEKIIRQVIDACTIDGVPDETKSGFIDALIGYMITKYK